MTEHISTHSSTATDDQSLGELISRVSEQTSRLIRDELRLAQLEMAEKTKKAGIGAGLFGGAGLFSLYGMACFVAAAILAIAGPLTAWAAALIVGGALFAVAGIAALIGRREVGQATPPIPAEAVEGVKQDVQTLKSGGHA